MSGTYNPEERGAEEARLRDLLAQVRATRQTTASPMVDSALRTTEEALAHALTFFSADTEVHPYLEELGRAPVPGQKRESTASPSTSTTLA